MTQSSAIVLTFCLFLLLFVAVGIYSSRYQQRTTTDYLLASRNVNPWFTALSALATGQSAFLFTGQVGYAYTTGISAIWLLIGWAIGDYMAWWFVFKRLREVSEQDNAETVSAVLGQGKLRIIASLSALITVIFLGTYAAAQLVASSKALNAVFGWNYQFGIIIGAVIVVLYCFSGGIRASIWTDAVQSMVMLGSLLILFTIAIGECQGFNGLWTQLSAIDPDLTRFNPTRLQWGFLPFFIGWIVAGFGAVGQPHIMVRAMAINSPHNLTLARNVKVIVGLVTSCTAITIGLAARVLTPDLVANSDPELALPYLALDLLPAVLVGLMLAGLFSATVSTADSQILSCSAALSQDLLPQTNQSYKLAKLATLTITAIVLMIALSGSNSVFTLVTFAWSALASSLGPVAMVRIFERPLNSIVAVTMMVTGLTTALIWDQMGLSSALYEALPGMAMGLTVYGIWWGLFASKTKAEETDIS